MAKWSDVGGLKEGEGENNPLDKEIEPVMNRTFTLNRAIQADIQSIRYDYTARAIRFGFREREIPNIRPLIQFATILLPSVQSIEIFCGSVVHNVYTLDIRTGWQPMLGVTTLGVDD